VSAVFVDYQQPARAKEAKAAAAVCESLAVPLVCVGATGPRIDVGVIRGRNALLLDLALMTATFDAGLVCIGVHAGTAYPDCSPAFVENVQAVYDTYAAGRIRVEAPFVQWSKRDIYDFAIEQGVPIQLTYSCLVGSERPCGVCESCKDVEALRVG
jgi:7-cyano-7-deazaguanine synthase